MSNKIAANQKILLTLAEAAELTSSSVSWWRQAVRGEKRGGGGGGGWGAGQKRENQPSKP